MVFLWLTRSTSNLTIMGFCLNKKEYGNNITTISPVIYVIGGGKTCQRVVDAESQP